MVASVIERRSESALHRQKVVLDTALENMSQGLCMFDADGRILLFNEHYGEMMGRTGLPLKGRLLIDVLWISNRRPNGRGSRGVRRQADRGSAGRQHRDADRLFRTGVRSALSINR